MKYFIQNLVTHPIVNISQNFRYGLRIKRKEKKLYIRKCNNITKNSKKRNCEITTSSNLQAPKIKYGYQI